MMKVSALALALSSAASVAFAQSLSSPQGWTPAPNKLPPADISWQSPSTILCNPTGILGPIQACPIGSGLSFVGGALIASGAPPFGPQAGFYTTANAMIAKAGGGYSGATALVSAINYFGTVASNGDSAVLPTVSAGYAPLKVCNGASHWLSVFPQPADGIGNLSAGSSINVAPQSCVSFDGDVTGKWAATSWASGPSGDLLTYGPGGYPTDSGILLSSLPSLPFGQTAFWTTAPALTALAGGGQTGATALTAVVNSFGTVASNGDSAVLPTVTSAQVGMVVIVGNGSGAGHYMNVYPAGSDLINGSTSPVAVGAGVSTTFALGSVPGGTAKWQATTTLTGVSGRLVNFNSNGQMQDSGTLLTALAPLNSPALTTPSIAGCSSQGSIIYVNSAGAESCISPATSGQVLVTKGAGANPVFASPITWMTSTTKATLTAATQYYMPLSGATISSNTAVGAASAILGLGGTFGVSGGRGQFTCTVATAPGAGQTDTCTLYQNATAEAVTCTISGTNTQCTDAADSFVSDGTHNYGIGFLMSATATAPVEVYTALSWSTP
jgi:hypothetical protein